MFYDIFMKPVSHLEISLDIIMHRGRGSVGGGGAWVSITWGHFQFWGFQLNKIIGF